MKTALLFLTLTLSWAGCSKPASPPAENPTPTQSDAPPPAAVPVPAPAPAPEPVKPAVQVTPLAPEGMKDCFVCDAKGFIACTVPSCREGLADCTNGCLKLSEGNWEHMHVDGYPDDMLWRIFTHDDTSRLACGQDRCGDMIEKQDGKWVDTGKCPVCGGKTKIPCSVCNGTGRLACPMCDGKQFVPEAWTAFNNPKLKNRPKEIRLKSGETVFGKVEATVGSTVYIRLENGKQVAVPSADIVSE